MEQESWKMDKEETGRQPPEGPILCTDNCGFFGSAITGNLCSQCYHKHVLEQAKATETATAVLTEQADGQISAPSLAEVNQLTIGGENDNNLGFASDMAPLKQQPNRCFMCKKRIGLTGFKCRCGNQFCALHRYSDKHNCSYDYRAAAREAIAKSNPVVKADKLEKL